MSLKTIILVGFNMFFANVFQNKLNNKMLTGPSDMVLGSYMKPYWTNKKAPTPHVT